MRRLLTALACTFACVAFFSPPAGARSILAGAAEDAPKQATLAGSVAKLELARLAGLRAIRITSLWSPGLAHPQGGELEALRNAAGASQLTGTRLFVAVYPAGSAVAPLTAAARAEFAAYATAVARLMLGYGVTDIVVGNEPNLNRFWMPQFGRQGSNVAAPAYLRVLAETYDALKAVSPGISVIGGALAPRGGDRPDGSRPTHSPTKFLADLGTAYRASGRTRPVMDVLSFHPYLESSKLHPSFRHPRSTSISIGDYDKLVAALSAAFDGTPQKGSRLPILYDEFGVQSVIPRGKASHYTNPGAPAAADAVPESVQARYYRDAFRIAGCQPTVVGLLIFHVTDESDLRAWQSGLYYADDTPKSSLAAVRDAALAAQAGTGPACQAETTNGDRGKGKKKEKEKGRSRR